MTVVREFADNAVAAALFGPYQCHLKQLERRLDVQIVARGNQLSLSGPPDRVEQAGVALTELYALAARQGYVETADVDAAARMIAKGDRPFDPVREIVTRKKRIVPRTPTQAHYLEAMNEAPLVFGLGPAGTGKTYLAVAKGVSLMLQGTIDRIILSRPAVEAGERLGFLPGDLKEKVDPYLRPLYDALHDMLSGELVLKKLAAGDIEIAPLAFMRGRTLSNAFVILDEAQNTTPVQMKMFLTRLGEGSRMVITGDLTQIDLPEGVPSGMAEAVEILRDTEGVKVVRFNAADVVRHDLVSRIVQAYDRAKERTLL